MVREICLEIISIENDIRDMIHGILIDVQNRNKKSNEYSRINLSIIMQGDEPKLSSAKFEIA